MTRRLTMFLFLFTLQESLSTSFCYAYFYVNLPAQLEEACFKMIFVSFRIWGEWEVGGLRRNPVVARSGPQLDQGDGRKGG